MEPFEQKLQSLKQTIKLSEHEHFNMRQRIESHINVSSVLASQKSPYVSKFSFVSFGKAMALFVLGIVVGGGSISYSSASALPGDVLYPIKTTIVEPLTESIIAKTPEAKATYQENLVYTRLAEIETLKKENRLNDIVQTQATQAVTNQISQFNTAIDNFKTDTNTADVTAKKMRVARELSRHENLAITPNSLIIPENTIDAVQLLNNENVLTKTLRHERQQLEKDITVSNTIDSINTTETKPIEDDQINTTEESISPTEKQDIQNIKKDIRSNLKTDSRKNISQESLKLEK